MRRWCLTSRSQSCARAAASRRRQRRPSTNRRRRDAAAPTPPTATRCKRPSSSLAWLAYDSLSLLSCLDRAAQIDLVQLGGQALPVQTAPQQQFQQPQQQQQQQQPQQQQQQQSMYQQTPQFGGQSQALAPYQPPQQPPPHMMSPYGAYGMPFYPPAPQQAPQPIIVNTTPAPAPVAASAPATAAAPVKTEADIAETVEQRQFRATTNDSAIVVLFVRFRFLPDFLNRRQR